MVDAICIFSNIYHIQHSVFIASQIQFPICKPEKTVHNKVKGLSGTFVGRCHLLPFTVATKSPKAFEPLVPKEKRSPLEAPQAFIRAPWLELSNPFFLGVTWLNISISHVPWATKFWASILGELCVCQGKWVITQGNWDFKVPFFPQDNLVGYFNSLCSFVIKFLAQILGEPCVFRGQMGGFMKYLGPELDHLGARDWKYSNKLP
jgi:hypothetical protein